jgi:hypothetical protein
LFQQTCRFKGTFRDRSGNIQGPFREHSGTVQGTFRDRSGTVRGKFRDYSGVPFRVCLRPIQETIWEHSG